MDVLMFLAPTSVLLGLLGLAAFWWTVKNDQYDDPDGDAANSRRPRGRGTSLTLANYRSCIASLVFLARGESR